MKKLTRFHYREMNLCLKCIYSASGPFTKNQERIDFKKKTKRFKIYFSKGIR